MPSFSFLPFCFLCLIFYCNTVDLQCCVKFHCAAVTPSHTWTCFSVISHCGLSQDPEYPVPCTVQEDLVPLILRVAPRPPRHTPHPPCNRSSGLCLWPCFRFIDWFVPCAECSTLIFKRILSLFSLLRCVGRCSCHGISLRRTGVTRKHMATRGRGRQASLSYCPSACQLSNCVARSRMTVFLIFILAKQIPHPFLLLGKKGRVVCSFSLLCRW